MEEKTQEQIEKQEQEREAYFKSRPWLFKPGQSGNPGGRPKGSKSLKAYAKEYLLSLPDEEKLNYIEGMDKKDIWEMAEGKPKQDLQVEGEITSKIISVDD